MEWCLEMRTRDQPIVSLHASCPPAVGVTNVRNSEPFKKFIYPLNRSLHTGRSTMAPSSSSIFPSQIDNMIILNLFLDFDRTKYDITGLLTCGLVCRTWLRTSQRLYFRTILIRHQCTRVIRPGDSTSLAFVCSSQHAMLVAYCSLSSFVDW